MSSKLKEIGKHIRDGWQGMSIPEKGILTICPIAAVAAVASDTGSREIPDYSATRDFGEVHAVGSKVIENDAAEYASKQTLKAIKAARKEFMKANGYTDSICTKCRTVTTEDANVIGEAADNWKVPRNEALAIAYQESRIRQLVDGLPVTSEDDGRGLYQLTPVGAKEIWYVFNDPQPRHRKFIKANKESIEKYSHLMRGDFDLIWDTYISFDARTNAIAGIGLYKLFKFLEKGNNAEALRDFFAGPTNKKKYVKSSKGYARSVQKHEDYFTKRCPPVIDGINKMKQMEENLYRAHKRTYLAKRLDH